MKSDVPTLIKELQEACRRSLYNGILVGGQRDRGPFEPASSDSQWDPPTSKRRRRDNGNTEKRTWEEVRSKTHCHGVVSSHR